MPPSQQMRPESLVGFLDDRVLLSTGGMPISAATHGGLATAPARDRIHRVTDGTILPEWTGSRRPLFGPRCSHSQNYCCPFGTETQHLSAAVRPLHANRDFGPSLPNDIIAATPGPREKQPKR
jgi:hypothetical protein